MTADQEIMQIADRAARLLAKIQTPELQTAFDGLEREARAVGRAWSGSNIGYHATVYFVGFTPPPPGVHFSSEWGLEDRWPTNRVDSRWQEHDHEGVANEIVRRAGEPDITAIAEKVNPYRDAFFDLKEAAASNLIATLKGGADPYLQTRLAELEELDAPGVNAIIKNWLPTSYTSRDSLAMHQGTRAAPHQCILAIPIAVRALGTSIERLSKIARESAAHMKRSDNSRNTTAKAASGSHVFVGHGPQWRELVVFLDKRLGLTVDEFNSVPVAGKSTQERLEELLDGAGFAFLVMTAEDERPDGKMQARLNVVHEVGLFQGRLGFKRAIVLLEQGCEEFSNVVGLGQIRFPKGNIKAVFEDVREVLEREEVLRPG
jgi:predicted nucleotide-binding protein